MVRKVVGYMRYDTEEELKVMNELWDVVDAYENYFQPVMKLISKEREGARIKKKYEIAKTPYQRVLENEHISEEVKKKLREEYDKLNPVELKRKIEMLENRLFKLAIGKVKVEEREFHIETKVMQ